MSVCLSLIPPFSLKLILKKTKKHGLWRVIAWVQIMVITSCEPLIDLAVPRFPPL